MTVTTRSQVIKTQSQNDRKPRTGRGNQETGDQVDRHHGLREKLGALTLFYEHQKQALKNQSLNPAEPEPRFTTHPSVDLFWSAGNGGGKRDCRDPLVRRPQLELDEEGKENKNCNVARKLALGSSSAVPPNPLPRKGANNHNKENVVQESEKARSNGGGGGGTRILAFVRLRPMAKKERDAGARSCVKIVDGRDVYLTEFATENDYLRLRRLRGRHFTFDASFPESASQQQVYSTTTAELVEAVLQGRNGSVFCYGATGAGKTHTMLGTVGNPGVMVLAIKDLFAKIRQMSFDGNHAVHLSYLEVYNETVRDLLSPGRPLVLREDKQGIVAAGLTQYRAYSTDEVMALLQQGNRNRTTEPTRANETSSRSHAILQVVVEYCAKDDASGNIVSRVGKLSLIDLAGSERALATDQRTLRSLEGANINRSLLALSSCINALVEGKKHIPYRNSKLTQLLKDSLGGACNTVMIANISPSNLVFGETQNTLHWADRAKQIRTKAYDVQEDVQIPESEADQAKLVLELQKENRELRTHLASQQQKLLAIQAQNLAANAPSPAPSTVSSHPASPAWPSEKRKTKPSFLGGGNCFTPETKKKRAADETVKELRKTVKELEAEIERMKKDHAFKMKQKDSLIHELSLKSSKPTGGALKKVITRASLRPKKPSNDELKSPCHRFVSPAPTSKKRSFWDTTSANSPSLATLNGRKTRSHVVAELTTAPSKLLQPGFALPRPEAARP